MKSKLEETKFLKFLADTWPSKEIIKFGSWTIRISDGAGKRASAISLDGIWDDNSFEELKTLLQKMNKSEIFLIYQSDSLIEEKLDPGMSVIAVESIPPVQLSALAKTVFFKLAA